MASLSDGQPDLFRMNWIHRFGHWFLPGLVLLLGGALVWTSQQYPELPDGHPGPGLFPTLTGMALVLAGVALFFHQRQRAHSPTSSNGHIWFLLLLIVPLPWLGQWIGLGGIAALISIGLGWLLKVPIKVLIALALGSGLVIWLIFTLGLGISL